jgi:hypothetical protein
MLKKGVSPLISTVIIISMSTAAVILVMTVAIPTIDSAKESAAMNEAEINMWILDNAIKGVASEGVGSLRKIDLKVSDGNYKIYNYSGNYTGSIEYSLAAKYNPMPVLSVSEVGNIKISTGVSTRGLVGYWKFDSFNSTNGTKDYSGYGNDGIGHNFTMNPVTAVTGKYGYAISLDGVNASIVVADSASLDITNAITLEAWIYLTSFPSTNGWYDIIYKGGDDLCNYQFAIIKDGTCNACIVFDFYSDGSWRGEVGYLTDLPVGVWTHVAVVYNNYTNSYTFYKNGTLTDTKSVDYSLETDNNILTIGKSGDSNSEYLNATVDEVLVYRRALTAEEVREQYSPVQSDYKLVVEYDKIYIEGIDRFGKGSHKFCIEKTGTYLGRPLVEITKCG